MPRVERLQSFCSKKRIECNYCQTNCSFLFVCFILIYLAILSSDVSVNECHSDASVRSTRHHKSIRILAPVNCLANEEGTDLHLSSPGTFSISERTIQTTVVVSSLGKQNQRNSKKC